MSYPRHTQSWTLTSNWRELVTSGHTVYYRGDGAHHDTGICSKCRTDAGKEHKLKAEKPCREHSEV